MILVTGFEPFEGMESNPSEDIARTLEERDIDCCILPVNYATFEAQLEKALTTSWDAVLMLGLALDRDTISLERVARNVVDATRPDNEGNASLRKQVVAGGPIAYFSTLPIEQMRNELLAAGIPASLSSSAGSYFCNSAFYLARHTLGTRAIPCGFVHLPPTPDLETDHGLPLARQVHAVQVMLEVIRQTQ